MADTLSGPCATLQHEQLITCTVLVSDDWLWHHSETFSSRLHFWWLARFHTGLCHSTGGGTVNGQAL